MLHPQIPHCDQNQKIETKDYPFYEFCHESFSMVILDLALSGSVC